MSTNLQTSQSPILPPYFAPRALTLKQRLFVEYYCGQARGNATESARLAGYNGTEASLGVIGCENLKNVKIKEAINDWFDTIAMDSGEIKSELSVVARCDWRDEDNQLSAREKIAALAELAKIRRLVGPETAVQVNVQTNIIESVDVQAIAEQFGIDPERVAADVAKAISAQI